jgi:hypothetical protein
MLKKGKKLISFVTGYWTHVFFLSLIVVGMPFSKFLMSLGTIALIINWLLEGGIKAKFKKFFSSKIALFSTGVYLLFVLGLLHTQDLNYGLNDLRIKLPLLAFPIIFSSSHRLKKTHYFLVVRLFVLSVLASTIYGFLVYQGLVPAKKEIAQIRDVSQFISHIRLSLMIVLSLFLIPKLFNNKLINMVFGITASLWLLYFLSFMESATGLILGFVTLFFISLYYLFKKKSLYGFAMLAPLFLGALILGNHLYSNYKEVKIDRTELATHSASGNEYKENPLCSFFDNGNYSNDLLCEKELSETWSNKSEKPYYGEGGVQFILIRYITSKGYAKDKEGLEMLTPNDIKNIENGFPNYLHPESSLLSRIPRLMFEIDGYIEGVNASGNSLAQRLEYWIVSKEIIKANPVFGVGTGDVPTAFAMKYNETSSLLDKKYQLRSHNQYFSITVSLGLLGLLLFLFCILYPVPTAFRERNYFYLICLCISLLSFISEDTLETQDGVFFCAFLTNFFLFSSRNRYLKSVD